MKVSVVATLVVLVLAVALASCSAEIYVTPFLGTVGQYPGRFPADSSRTCTVSFGYGFQSIRYAGVHWRGWIGSGSSPENRLPPYGDVLPHGGYFWVGWESTDARGMNVSFDLITTLWRTDLSGLYDGEATLKVSFVEIPNSSTVLGHCMAELYSADFVVDGDMVPEPVPGLAVSVGLAAMASWQRRTRKHVA